MRNHSKFWTRRYIIKATFMKNNLRVVGNKDLKESLKDAMLGEY